MASKWLVVPASGGSRLDQEEKLPVLALRLLRCRPPPDPIDDARR